jgi:hypothetical protein
MSIQLATSSFQLGVFEEVQVLFAKIAVDSEGKVMIVLPDINNEGQKTETLSILKDLHAQGNSQYIYKASLHPL